MYAAASHIGLLPSIKNKNLFQTWNYYNDYYPGDSSSHHSNPFSIQKPNDNESSLEKFHHDSLIILETGEKKNIQQLTTHDFITSAKQNQQYSSLLARVGYIGSIDKITGKAELRFYINGVEKSISYYVSQEMPFFVHQYSCWSSISPKQTYCTTGLTCRQLECGDLIIAIIDKNNTQSKISSSSSISSSSNMKPNYSQQSPTKCLVERYMNEKISSSSMDNVIPKSKRFKICNE
ncbi:unnamed protein product [Rotaria magnacalcarata]|uniref:AXH domain-containing protein n=1 Tax=Rotaria magnacalcarata TaxID=392030 RepID=A0A819GSB1_9BILA|nr:unnamed protein product [Rotaria magnacalcarata]CAF1662971.1 unnamed protein product [Rotaria magnacalcarata]CAF2038894.1 unnamed protein product [Rotaria magnacalcarata]CAF2059062.1 unnamed protein product [Rotaria magnacalcarata]CAF2190183.1 unnamed protein product [Rotaria magnacalcarata]